MTTAQSVCLGKEILVCGGYRCSECYSYHITKKEWRLVCKYSSDIILCGHTVVCYESGTQTGSSRMTLLSFGGRRSMSKNFYHSQLMYYKSVWSEKDKDNDNDKDKEKEDTKKLEKNEKQQQQQRKQATSIKWNEWTSLPNGVMFGKDKAHELCGARAVVSGVKRKLLFITRYPNHIDVVDLNTFTYITDVRNPIVPIWKSELGYHGFVLVAPNQFLLVNQQENVLIYFDEDAHTFSYQFLCPLHSLANLIAFGCARFRRQIFILGGWNCVKGECSKDAFVFHIDRNQWYECVSPFPVGIKDLAVTPDIAFSCLHIFGGSTGVVSQKTHFALQMLVSEEDIEKIVRQWQKQSDMRQMGWINEFNFIIANFLLFVNSDVFQIWNVIEKKNSVESHIHKKRVSIFIFENVILLFQQYIIFYLFSYQCICHSIKKGKKSFHKAERNSITLNITVIRRENRELKAATKKKEELDEKREHYKETEQEREKKLQEQMKAKKLQQKRIMCMQSSTSNEKDKLFLFFPSPVNDKGRIIIFDCDCTFFPTSYRLSNFAL
ncbi:hypothetical protein RFI_25901 [Reticulomyxa filosa]|uniref:Kelch motif family protein n=1 Tax=Reticulomyxa filosa TaxID=46433 RepID=X6MC92_RETFI|nr:hypothetical protein RFI_25901 [Reticulomyxa filosa]|eukprot:ETO11474.1 hypothetical protein RFI_25901 [Reticulomyxa filosa]